MIGRVFAAALLAGTASATLAGETPLIAPAPAWVKPVDAATGAKPGGDAPITVLLADTQLHFERGSTIAYNRTVVRVDSAPGLAVGNISLPWRPDVGDLTVHRLAIRRGDSVIDVLAGGKPFTVARREPNMESAMLDGVLTANVQAEGLQVGDVLEIATSVAVRDPVLGGHAEQLLSVGGPFPIGRAHVRASWPAALPVRLKTGGPLPAPPQVTVGGERVAELTLDGVAPFEAPRNAPPRYQLGRLVEISDFTSWAEVGALMAPLYAKAAVVPASGPLATEIARIRAASADPGTRTLAALALVQGSVRYVALAMGSGGLVPADATATWERRYGDCKAKTVLLLGVLHALGIAAEPVAVNAVAGDSIDSRLPAIGVFNHVLVRATVAGKTYWLDGTRTGDTALDRLVVPDTDWGLPLVAKGAALVRMVPPPLTRPTSETTVTIDATAGIAVPAPVELSTTLRGDGATATNAALSNLVGEARDRALRDMWKRQYDFIDVSAVGSRFDPATGELRLTATGKARMDWSSGWYETDGLALGYKADFRREPGFGSDAPFAVGYPRFTKAFETIKLPPGFPASSAVDKAAIDRTVGGVEYKRTATIEGRVFRAEASERAIAGEFPASEAPKVEAALREMANATVYLRKPARYAMTPADLGAAMATTPATVNERLSRGFALLDAGRQDDAIKDFDAVLAQEPKNAVAFANRGLSYAWKDDYAAAARDLDAAAALDPANAVVYRGRALSLERQGEFGRALPLWDKAVQLDPGSSFALIHRARAHRSLGEVDAALADTGSALALNPADLDARLMRFNILRDQGKNDAAMAELRAGIAAAPDQTYAYVAAANGAAALGRRDEAMRLFDRALAIRREAYIYLNRAGTRAADDVAARLADIDAALSIEPAMTDALAMKAMLLQQRGDGRGAAALYDKLVAAQPDDGALRLSRGLAYVKAGDQARANADLLAAGTWAKGNANRLNTLCWNKALAGTVLDGALADCDAALAIEPKSAAILDSKGLVLLRLGRNDEAIKTYGQALAVSPRQAASLFGRSVAYARAGDRTRSDADLAAARAVSAGVEEEFAGFGVKR